MTETSLNIKDPKNAIWVEKYRPVKISDCIVPDRFKLYFNEILEKGEIQHLILSGSAGVGKTSLILALCEELKVDYKKINCVLDGNLDTIREVIDAYAATKSFKSPYKVVILDELGEGKSREFQPALKGFIEKYNKNCRFVITTNYLNSIIEPIQSRCATLEFNFTKEERKGIAKLFLSRMMEILDNENIKYDKPVVAATLKKYFPDFRKILVELQKHSYNRQLSDNIISNLNADSITNLFNLMKEKKWTDIRKWVADNIDNDFPLIIRALYDNSFNYLELSSNPQLVLLLSQYDERMGRVVDKEITLAALMAEIISNCDFK